MGYMEEPSRPDRPPRHTGGDDSGACFKGSSLKQLREKRSGGSDCRDTESVYNSLQRVE